ncbi:MAG: hypothetical protein ACI8RZ_000061 [Myxococcota bacterium]
MSNLTLRGDTFPGMKPFTFAVIADSHFHPPGIPAQAAWESDASFNDRNRHAVDLVVHARPEFVVHVGDVPHPVPGLVAHERALDVAQATYAALPCPLFMVPGNHDIGDKPHPWAPAPTVTVERHEAFTARWGPPWQVFEHSGCRMLLIDTPVLNSGLPMEAEQWAWLEGVLAEPMRTFVFLHYPPFLLNRDEPEHYDNIAQPARDRLLALLAGTEAIFCGHVHRFFWNPVEETDLYVVPATSFVRPGYSELGRTGPGAEFGRNDEDKLGIAFVHVTEDGHRVEWVRTNQPRPALPALMPGQSPAPACPLGVTLRHAWDQPMDVPCDGLDPFRRKQARDDLVIQAIWELGITQLRLPISDLIQPATRSRLIALARHGQRAVLFSAELPNAETLALLVEHREIITAFELIVPRSWVSRTDLLPDLDGLPPVWLSAVGRKTATDEVCFSHFPRPGFLPEEDIDLPSGAVVRISPERDAFEGVASAERVGAVAAHVWLPRAEESSRFTDDAAVTRRVVEAAIAAHAHPAISVILDAFLDHDRGYYPRNGLLTRQTVPRPAFHALRNLSRLLPAGATVTRIDGGYALSTGAKVLLSAGAEGIDLVTGQPAEDGPRWVQ